MQFIAVEMVIITNSLIKHCSIPLSGHFYDRIFFATLVVVRFFSLLSVNKIPGFVWLHRDAISYVRWNPSVRISCHCAVSPKSLDFSIYDFQTK